VNKINRGKRLKFAEQILGKSAEFWKNLVYSDESKFNLFHSDGKCMVWSTPREEFKPKSTILMVNPDDGSVIVCGCFTSRGGRKLCVLDPNLPA
jgi:hypothetical protein